MKTIVLSLKINALEFIKNNSSTPINFQLWSGNSRLVSLMLWNLFKMQNLSIGIAFINCHQKKDWNISTIKKISQLYSRNYLTIFMIRSNWWRTTRNTFEFGEVQSFQTRLWAQSSKISIRLMMYLRWLIRLSKKWCSRKYNHLQEISQKDLKN